MRLRFCIFAVCFLVCPGLARDCDWDQSTDPDQDLDPASLPAGARNLGRIMEVSDPESCRAACCKEPDCDLALLGFPADGAPQCALVSCGSRRDACVLQPSTQFKVYRKKVTKQPRQAAPEKPHIAPLLGSWEPRSNDTNNVRCRLPMKVGACRAAFPKFYYDVTNQSCRRFMYGGCGANQNNFDSQEECEATCSGVSGSVLPDESTPAPPEVPDESTPAPPEVPDESTPAPPEVPVKAPRMAPAFDSEASQESPSPVEYKTAENNLIENKEMQADDFAELCEAAPEAGPCRAAFQRWYYNSKTGGCQSFIYGGCRGNKNNYNDMESCVARCSAVTVLPSKKASSEDQEEADYKAYCMSAPDPGPCRAAFSMFYYDSDAASCKSFIYGGCRGNQNRYGDMNECMDRCGGEGSFEGRGRPRNRWTAAFFLFVTLAVISALLLTTLVIITLRRHGLSRGPSSISDKEELLPDPDEQCSVESLTVPESPKPDKA